MPRIQEVQFVHWGSLRPDPVPLLAEGINVATGPNGSGKTCLLDGIKLLLGVTDFTAGRTPAKYVFDGGGSSGPADRAYLRATFGNPISPGRQHRVFAWAGHGCEDTHLVTVVCVVTGQERWYVVLPGRIRWGAEGRRLAEDLAGIDEVPRSRRLGPRKFDDLLDRAGVTKALRGVLALPQGATDRLVEQPPTGLLRRLLELTGKQITLDEFRDQRARYEQVRMQYADTMRRYHAEQKHLALLEVKARDHTEWRAKREELAQVEGILLPAARYRDLSRELGEVSAERDQRKRAVEEDEAALAQLDGELPVLVGERQALDDRLAAARTERDRVFGDLSALDQGIGEVRGRSESIQAERDHCRALAGARAPAVAARHEVECEARLREADRRHGELRDSLQRLREEIAILRAGRPVPPAGLDAFRRRLAEEDIRSTVVAEAADLSENADEPARVRAEAALGDALWCVIVPPEARERAVALAVEEGHRWPIAVAGEGAPYGALAYLDGPHELHLLLEHLDAEALGNGLPNGVGDAVSADGVRHGRVLSRLSAPERPVLGRRARERRLAVAEEEATSLGNEIVRAEAELKQVRKEREEARTIAEAARRLPDLETDAARMSARLGDLVQGRVPISDRHEALQDEVVKLGRDAGTLQERVRTAERRRDEVANRLNETRRPQLDRYARRAEQLARELAEHPLTPTQRSAVDGGDLAPTSSLEHDCDRLRHELEDASRYPEDVRDELILGQRDDQRRIVADVDTLVTGRQQDLDDHQKLVDEARSRFDEHVRAVVRLLNEEFGRICAAAGADGEIRLVPGGGPDDLGVDVRVAHRAGEPRRSYRDASHSGGQRAKIAILILLAAMSIGGAADLLVMDEHIAHLDSTNIDHIADLMGALKDRVQFILATPTNAESLRLGWCDLQLAFLPRLDGEAYSPPIRILTRLGADDLEARFASAQLTL